jgi:cellulose synthase/poly-beta-1,6-N-acetylglucosamine synthase-like glycosyltransferase
MRASVVVPASRPKLIGRCVDSLLAMGTGDFEVIVVTRPGVKYSNPDSRLRVLEQDGSGTPNALNCGIRAAAGRFIAFTGEDCVVSRYWLEYLLGAFDDSEAGGAGSIPEAFDPRSGIASLEDAAAVWPGGLIKKYERMRKHGIYLCASSAAYRAEVVRGLAGFDELLPAGEDLDLSGRVKAAGFRLALVPQARVWREYPTSLGSVARQQRTMATGDLALAGKYRQKAVRLKLLAAIPYYSIASIPYGLSHGQPALPAYVFFKGVARFSGSLR